MLLLYGKCVIFTYIFGRDYYIHINSMKIEKIKLNKSAFCFENTATKGY